MANFVLIYTGGAGMEMDPEKRAKVMAAWGAWYGKMGASIVDGGAPFAASTNISAAGVANGPWGDSPPTGYTIISADSLEAATAACEGHPQVEHGGQVTIFQTLDMTGDG